MNKKGIMAQEEKQQQQKHSNNSSSGGKSSGGGGAGGGGVSYNRSQKKMKQKKVPQRGLGVAQLEKIRMEEQKKKGVILISPNHQMISPSNSSSCLSVQCPPTTFRPSMIVNSSSSALAPLQPPSPLPNVDIMNSNPLRFPKSLNVGNGEMGWSAVSVPPTGNGGGGNWSKVWRNGENGLRDRGIHRMDPQQQHHSHNHHGFAYRPHMNLPFESDPPNPFLPIPDGLPRSRQFPQQSSSMVNIASGISPSSILNFQMEPPSNQNLCAESNYSPLWPDEEKMVGMKRPYPFAMETPPAPAFHFKYTPCCVASVPKSEESTSCSNTCTVNTDLGYGVTREGHLQSSVLSEPNHKEIKVTENRTLNGDFLSLAPPAASAASPHLSSQYAFASSGPLSQFNRDSTIPGQGPTESMRPPFFSFFPAAKKDIGQAANSSYNRNGELTEKVDLSLKL